MAGVCKIEIRESEVELKQLLGQAKTGSEKERLQVLYLLKTKKARACDSGGRNSREKSSHPTKLVSRISSRRTVQVII